ncbi:TPR_REGION domain-containing protein, partial [Haematococcus lacustris]
MSRTHTQPLPSKEASLFRQLVEQYEEKRYKKAVKTADQILKKFPEHGESLAMKGLTLSNMGADKKDEAYELVRRGLKADLKSHVCWHVYGLMYRQDQDYKEAIKCYQNALRIDKENVQIRDLEGFVATRNTLLVLKPNHKNHWIAFALAHHANKNYSVAVEVLQAYEATLTEVAPSEAYEHSELLLYKAMVLDEGGRLEEALTLLDSSKDKICDKVGMLEARASLLLRSGRAAEAEAQYRALLALNSDHYKWHEGLQAALGL